MQFFFFRYRKVDDELDKPMVIGDGNVFSIASCILSYPWIVIIYVFIMSGTF